MQQPTEEGPAAKRSMSEHHHGADDAPSFKMEDLPMVISIPSVQFLFLIFLMVLPVSSPRTTYLQLWDIKDWCFLGFVA